MYKGYGGGTLLYAKYICESKMSTKGENEGPPRNQYYDGVV